MDEVITSLVGLITVASIVMLEALAIGAFAWIVFRLGNTTTRGH